LVIATYNSTTIAVNIARIITINHIVATTAVYIYVVSAVIPTVIPIGRPTIRRAVRSWPPPASTPVSPGPVTDAKSDIEPTSAVSIIEAPSYPGVISDIKSPGIRSGIIMTSKPWAIIISGSIYNCGSVNKCIQVSRSVPHVNILRCHIVYVNIFHVVNRIARWNQCHNGRS
jgi:hypothetical protein